MKERKGKEGRTGRNRWKEVVMNQLENTEFS